MNCRFDYSKDKSEGRVFFSKRKEVESTTDLDNKRVYDAFLKVSKRVRSPVLFSRSLGK